MLEIIDQTVTITRSGQATIPKEIRDQLGISVPGKVRSILDEEGNVEMEKIPRNSKEWEQAHQTSHSLEQAGYTPSATVRSDCWRITSEPRSLWGMHSRLPQRFRRTRGSLLVLTLIGMNR